MQKRPDLLFDNVHFCGENPDQCGSQLGMGYKIYMLVVNFGWMPEYSVTKVCIGWIILTLIIALVLSGFYKLLKCVCKKISSHFGVHFSRWKVRVTRYDPLPLSERVS